MLKIASKNQTMAQSEVNLSFRVWMDFPVPAFLHLMAERTGIPWEYLR
jgi:hypothetical protein